MCVLCPSAAYDSVTLSVRIVSVLVQLFPCSYIHTHALPALQYLVLREGAEGPAWEPLAIVRETDYALLQDFIDGQARAAGRQLPALVPVPPAAAPVGRATAPAPRAARAGVMARRGEPAGLAGLPAGEERGEGSSKDAGQSERNEKELPVGSGSCKRGSDALVATGHRARPQCLGTTTRCHGDMAA